MSHGATLLPLSEATIGKRFRLVEIHGGHRLTRRLLALGQYLAPSGDHVPVARYVKPEEFEMWAANARDMGFTSVASGPLVRSSYRAGEMKDGGQKEYGVDSIRKAG